MILTSAPSRTYGQGIPAKVDVSKEASAGTGNFANPCVLFCWNQSFAEMAFFAPPSDRSMAVTLPDPSGAIARLGHGLGEYDRSLDLCMVEFQTDSPR